MSQPVARHWVIDGRVQGVGYRMWLQTEAEAAEVQGWVRNLSDGRVEALLWGPPEVLDRLEALAWEGPEQARVGQVVATPWPREVQGGRFRQVPDATEPAQDPGLPAVSGTDDT